MNLVTETALVPNEMAPLNSPLLAFAVAPVPTPMAKLVRLLVQPPEVLIPKAEKQAALARGVAPRFPAASAPDTKAASSTPPLARSRFIEIPCYRFLCFPPPAAVAADFVLLSPESLDSLAFL